MKTRITSKDHQGITRVLVREADFEPINVGDKITCHRGDVQIALGGKAPHKNGSTGKVYVDGAEYYPSVFGLIWF